MLCLYRIVTLLLLPGNAHPVSDHRDGPFPNTNTPAAGIFLIPGRKERVHFQHNHVGIKCVVLKVRPRGDTDVFHCYKTSWLKVEMTVVLSDLRSKC